MIKYFGNSNNDQSQFSPQIDFLFMKDLVTSYALRVSSRKALYRGINVKKLQNVPREIDIITLFNLKIKLSQSN